MVGLDALRGSFGGMARGSGDSSGWGFRIVKVVKCSIKKVVAMV
jgi:hypothetical protein